MYSHQKEYLRAVAASFATTGIKATFSAGLVPMVLRSISVTVTTQMTVTAPVLTPKFRPTAGSAAGESALATITVPTSAVAGKVIYKKSYNQVVKPGEHLALDVTTAATAGVGDIVAEFEPAWEQLANNANAIASV